MSSIHYIAGDWGTSNLRLYLCERSNRTNSSKIIETRFGPGISQIQGDFEDRFFNLTQDWLDAHPGITVLLSGMVGSTIGWKEAPYLTCPVNSSQIAGGRLNFVSRGTNFSILSGLRSINPLGSPDVMRGEELQLLGWMNQNPDSGSKLLFALPGTHNKWAFTASGQVQTFLTAFTGELFALLRSQSILISEASSFAFNSEIFLGAVDSVRGLEGAHLVHILFSTRAKQVLGEINQEEALSYLSGLIIGADITGALEKFEDFDKLIIIGEPTLSKHYRLALDHLGVSSSMCDPSEIAISGYDVIFSEILASQSNK